MLIFFFFLIITVVWWNILHSDLFLEESPIPAGLIQPPSVQTSWKIDFHQQEERED